VNLTNFYDEIHRLFEEYYDVDLNIFLLAILGFVENFNSEECSFRSVLEILEKGLKSPPIAFSKEWISVTKPPDDGRMARKFTNPEIFDPEPNQNSNRGGMTYTIEVMKFQCAEFERMRDNALKDEYRYFGVTSSSGHRWYNFSAYSVLECGARCMIDNGDQFEKLDWSFLGDLLEDGRVYE